MSIDIQPIDGGLFAVPGLTGGAVVTGVKPSGKPDLAVIRADKPMSAAGMFTTCAAAAAPVEVCREMLATAECVRTIVVNSGNANALTGATGRLHAEQMVSRTQQHHGGPVLVLSTGVIGVPLPVDKVLDGIARLEGALHPDADVDVADAMRTTDTTRKQMAVQFEHAGQTYTVGGVAKGSGMIHPSMATMLAVVATDAPVPTAMLRGLLPVAVDQSFHEISVDGDTSTNDAVIALARAPEGDALDDDGLTAMREALVAVCRGLAGQILDDGEGMSRIMDIEVRAASSEHEARAIARSIATSSLVKTALAGGDPNWGRILAAAGNAGVPFDPQQAALLLGGLTVFHRGEPLEVDDEALQLAFSRDRVHVALELGRGDATGCMRTTDLTHRYVEINAEYTT